jgi:hypothetical protein
MLLSIRRPFVASLLVPLLATCGGTEPSGPAPAGMVVSVALGDTVMDRVILTPAPAIQLVDADGEEIAVEGVPVTIQSLSPGVLLVGTATRETDESGVATFEGIRFQGPAGQIQVRFSAPEVPPLSIGGIKLVGGLPATVTLSTVATSIPVAELVPSFNFLLRDSSGNSIAGLPVTFTISQGGGTAPAGGVTASNGRVTVTEWRMGTTIGPNRLTLAIPSVPTLTAGVTVASEPGTVTRLLIAPTWPAPALAGENAPTPLTATVTDTFGHPVTAQAVVFRLVRVMNGQTISIPNGTVNTDAAGGATLAALTLPTVAGTYQFGARVTRHGVTASADTTVTVIPDSAVAIAVEQEGGRWPVGVPMAGRAAVRDQYSNLHVGASLDLSVAAGGGMVVRLDSVSAADGWTRFTWSPGSLTAQQLLVTSAGLPPETVSVAPIAPADLLLESGDGQGAVAVGDLPGALAVRMVDSAGAGIEGAELKLFRNGVFVKSWLTDAAGRVGFVNVPAGPSIGEVSYTITSNWIPGDTVTAVAHVAAGPPASLVAVAPLPRFEVGTPVDGALVLKLTDGAGNRLAGFAFGLSVSAGALADDSVTTDSAGEVTIPSWQLGTISGTQSLTATSGEFSKVLNFQVKAGPVASLVLSRVAAGFAAESIGVAPRFTARDSFGNPVAGDTLLLSITAGGGSVPPMMTFDVRGVIDIAGWVLGPVPGVNTLHAEAGGHSFDVSATSTAAGTFNIVLQPIDPRWAAEFRAAAFQWRRRITGDITDINNLTIPAGTCSPFQQAISGTVDDLIIAATIRTLDGPGGLLGSAGPCYIRTATSLPLVGTMEFDLADIVAIEEAGSLDDLIMHEMGHVLGIGTIWTNRSLLVDAGTVSSSYVGAGGKAGWAEIGGVAAFGVTNVPVENSGGPGTRDAHWREVVMPSELMTGYLSAAVNPMSAVTVKSLGDLGYTIDAATADPYTVQTAPPVEPGGRGIRIRDQVGTPRFTVDEHGKVTPIGH